MGKVSLVNQGKEITNRLKYTFSLFITATKLLSNKM